MNKQRYTLFFLIPLIILLYTCEDVDTTPPTVSISSHYSGQSISEIVTIKVSIGDNNGIKKVEFYINDELALTVSKSPFEYSWNTAEVEDGEYIVKAIAYDNSDNSTESQPIMLIVDNSGSYPQSVNINSITYTQTEMTIIWTKSIDSDFNYYELLSSESEDGDKNVIIELMGENDTSLVITDFDPSLPTWYWIAVTDTVGLTTIGNEYFVLDDKPTPIELYPIQYQNGSLFITWSPSRDNDFNSYSLLESFSIDMTDMTAVYSTTSLLDTSVIISGVSYDELRYYQLKVSDFWGLDTTGTVLSGSYMKILYTSFRTSGKGEIFLMNPDGLGQINLTNQTNSLYDDINDFNPIFFPLGNKIVYVRSENDGEIYSMNIDGSHQTNLTNYSSDSYSSDYHDFNPVVSPDGERICFVSLRNGDREIYIMNKDGSGTTNLTNSQGKDDTPIFTPNGEKIVFTSERDGNMEIYVMNTDGSNQTNLTNNSSYDALYDNNNVNPVITPSGNNIIFISGRDGDGDIYIIGIDGSNPRNLTNNSVYDFYQQVSPDGQYIVFLSLLDNSNSFNVYVMGIDGSNITNVSNGGGYYPAFSQDSQKVIFTAHGEIYSVNIDGSNLKQLTSDSWDKKSPRFRPYPF